MLDVAIIAFLLYKVLSLFKSTQAERIFFGVLFFLLVTWLASYLELHAVSYILTHVVEWGILALIILFQPEIRQLLERLGAKNIRVLRFLKPEKELTNLEKCIDHTVLACSEMSRSKTGVLIVFEREIQLNDMLRSGTEHKFFCADAFKIDFNKIVSAHGLHFNYNAAAKGFVADIVTQRKGRR